MSFLFGKKKEKTITELEEEADKLQAEDRKMGVELSVAQKKYAIEELRKRGLEAKHFGNTSQGGTWSRIWSWLKSH